MRTIEQLVRSGGREQGSARQSSGFVPVSYTHLDVYKRQMTTLWKLSSSKRGCNGTTRHGYSRSNWLVCWGGGD